MSLLDDASLVLIPSGYKEDKLYSVKPTNGDGDFTFTRASSATRVNSDGLIEDVPVNKLTYSNTFNTTWTTTRATLTSGESGYDGSNNAWAMVDDTNNSTHLLVQTLTISEGKATFSIYAKAGAVDFIVFRFEGATVDYAYFNLSNGTIGTVDANYTNVSITDVGNGWYKCEATNESVDKAVVLSAQSDNDPTYAGAGTTAIYIQDAQVNKGATAKTYFPTTDGLNVPRIDYSNGCGSLLLEPQRTNLVPRSEDINTGWSKLNVTVDNNQTTSPDGTLNAALSTVNSSNSQHASYDTLSSSVTSGQPYYISCFVKKHNSKYIRLVEGYTGATLNFNLDDETYNLTNGSSDAIVEAFDNGWYRIGFKFTPTTTNSQFALYINNNSNENSYTGNGEAVYLWGAQVEEGSYPTSYIPTAGSATTRIADACNGAGTSATFNSAEGVLMVELKVIDTDSSNKMITLSNGTSSTRLLIRYVGTTLLGQLRISGSNQYEFAYTPSNIADNLKIAIKYKINDFSLYVNGTQINSSNSGNVFSSGTLTELAFDDGGGSSDFYGDVKQLQYYPTALTDLQLESLTSFSSFVEMANALNYTII